MLCISNVRALIDKIVDFSLQLLITQIICNHLVATRPVVFLSRHILFLSVQIYNESHEIIQAVQFNNENRINRTLSYYD